MRQAQILTWRCTPCVLFPTETTTSASNLIDSYKSYESYDCQAQSQRHTQPDQTAHGAASHARLNIAPTDSNLQPLTALAARRTVNTEQRGSDPTAQESGLC